MWKPLLKTVLIPVLVTIYASITNHLTDFPIDQDSFVNTVLYFIGLGIGGWTTSIVRSVKRVFSRQK